MKLSKIIIKNFRGIQDEQTIYFDLFNCIVGQNDAGKSTILKALDCFLNNVGPSVDDLNKLAKDSQIEITCFFDPKGEVIFLNEEIGTTLENEEIVDGDGMLAIKKIWQVTSSVAKPKNYLLRKIYDDNDCLSLVEADLMKLCSKLGIITKKGNGDDFNNVEKREKIREYNVSVSQSSVVDFEEIPSTGVKKIRNIFEAIVKNLPHFEYFKADTSLSETDTAIQNFFKKKALKIINDQLGSTTIQDDIDSALGKILKDITDKINEAVDSSELIEPIIEFDWSKVVSTKFRSKSSGVDIPLSSRGDGFRRITMMAYFEHLAETNTDFDDPSMIFGFEEPETFLHPSSQEKLLDRLRTLTIKDYQILLCTHSPAIVSKVNVSEILHITRPSGAYCITQPADYKIIADDLGITAENSFVSLFSSYDLMFLVEGIDDVLAMQHLAKTYKANGLIEKDFEELKVLIIPIGGCGQVKHWKNLDLFTQIGKPYFIFLDSDKDASGSISPNEEQLTKYGILPANYLISKKRLLENYIPVGALKRLVPEIEESKLNYLDFGHAKNMCGNYPEKEITPGVKTNIRGKLGGKNVAEKHFCSLNFDELRSTFFDGTEDEFIKLYFHIKALL